MAVVVPGGGVGVGLLTDGVREPPGQLPWEVKQSFAVMSFWKAQKKDNNFANQMSIR